MGSTDALLSGGIMVVVIAVVMVIGGLILTQTYMSAVTAAGSPGIIYSTETCIQYSANDTTACTNVTNGTYSTANWSTAADPNNAVDNDSTTASTDLCTGSDQNFSMTYPLAQNVTSALWEVIYTLESTNYAQNFTLNTTNCDVSDGNYTLYVVASTEVNESCDLSFGCLNATGITWFTSTP